MIRGGVTGVRWGVGALVLSLSGHGFALLAMPRAAHAGSTPPPQRIDQVEIFIEAPPLPPPEAVTPPPPVAERRPDRVPTERRPEPTPRETTPEVPPVETHVAVAPSDPRETTPEPSHVPPTTTVAIDPLAVARGSIDFGGPRMPRAADTSTPDVETPEERDRRLSGELASALGTAANARPEGFGRRVLPAAQHRPDGSLAYPLGQITAIVNPDGSFTFDDSSGVRFGGMGNSQREGMQVGWGLEEWLMRRHGNDPHAATRRWFMEQTESMRGEMEQHYVERQAQAAGRRMRGQLTRLLADEARPIEERRRRIFAIWDDCAEGELIGDAVRAAVVTFVRENLAEGSELAFGDAELDALNRTRQSTVEFRPYAR